MLTVFNKNGEEITILEGTHELLLERTDNDISEAKNISINSLSNYSYLIIEIFVQTNDRIAHTQYISTDIFKNRILQIPYPYDTDEFTFICYAGDATIAVRNYGTAHGTRIYGVK